MLWAIIMARGESRRMGRPKGEVEVPGQGRTLLRAVCDLYPPSRFRRLVVTQPALRTRYEQALVGPEDSAAPEVFWVTGPGGGTTAGTLAAAMDFLADRGESPDVVLAHPVDLPLVRPATRDLLLAALDEGGGPALRPAYRGEPGHPVLFRAEFLARLLDGSPPPERDELSMGQLLAREPFAASCTTVAVDDPGVINDFDAPSDLEGVT